MHNKKCCGFVDMLSKILLIVGGLNWGLIGVGTLINFNLNLVNMIFGGVPILEAAVYILVGIAAVLKIFSCGCAKCKTLTESCGSCCGNPGASEEEPKM